ncbi:MAG: glycosyltransferase family protein [Verrucomicrobiota bacterium]
MRIAYGLASSGRGHTTRAIGLAEALREAGHEVRFYTRGEAAQLLRKRFNREMISPMRTPRFVWGEHGINLGKTTLLNADFIVDRNHIAEPIADDVASWGADAIISDFEPLMWSVSRKLGLPFISFNSQHFAVACKISNAEAPWWKTWRLLPIGLLSAIFAPTAELYVISKPFALPTRLKHMHLVGPMIRPIIERSEWKPAGTHVLAYVRASVKEAYSGIVRIAEELGLELRVYNTKEGELGPKANYRPISEEGFIHDLTTADLVISTAGSQLIGEVAYLGAPTLLIPESGQVEQEINAQLASNCYARIAETAPEEIDQVDARQLLKDLHNGVHRPIESGTHRAADLVLDFLEEYAEQQTEAPAAA